MTLLDDVVALSAVISGLAAVASAYIALQYNKKSFPVASNSELGNRMKGIEEKMGDFKEHTQKVDKEIEKLKIDQVVLFTKVEPFLKYLDAHFGDIIHSPSDERYPQLKAEWNTGEMTLDRMKLLKEVLEESIRKGEDPDDIPVEFLWAASIETKLKLAKLMGSDQTEEDLNAMRSGYSGLTLT